LWRFRESAYHPAIMKCAVSQLSSLDARRICIIKPSALGDVVQSLPLLPALRRRFPQAQVHWVINREFVGLLEGNSALAEVIPFDRRGTWRDFIRLLIELRRRRFDLVFDLQGLLRSAAMTLATGAAVRIGLETAREGAGRACQLVVPGTDWSVPAHQRCKITDPLQLGTHVKTGSQRAQITIDRLLACDQDHDRSLGLVSLSVDGKVILKNLARVVKVIFLEGQHGFHDSILHHAAQQKDFILYFTHFLIECFMHHKVFHILFTAMTARFGPKQDLSA
jgi:hypothetical protein